MPPKKTALNAADTPKAGKGRGKGSGKSKKGKEEENLSDEELEEEEEKVKATSKKQSTTKKPASEEEEEEDLDDEEFDEDEEDFDDEEDEEEEEEDFDGGSKQMKTLFIKNLPMETTEDQIKALSPDILKVRMDVSQSKTEKNPKYAILDFADQATAAKNLEELKGKVVNGISVVADYVIGQATGCYVKPQFTLMIDPLKLYVTGFGRDVIIDQLKEMFPTSSDITLPLSASDNNRPVGYAFIHYNDEKVAKDAHDSMQDYVYRGRTLVVMYGKKSTGDEENPASDSKRKSPGIGGPATKRSKQSKDEEDEDNGDEDEEDEEEELADEERE